MRHNLKYIIIGVFAFIFAITASSVIGTIVNSIIPNPNKQDPEGKLDKDPQEKSKAEWLQQLEGGGPPKTKETKAETTPEAPQQTTVETSVEAAPVYQQVNQAPPVVPPTPRVGPGNFDSPQPYTAPPVTRTGPGNM